MHFLGIDIGGTKSAVCVGNADTGTLCRRQVATRGPETTLNALTQHARALLDAYGPVEAAGVVCGGPLDTARGLVLSPPNLPGWDAVPVVDHVYQHLGIRASLQNDANAGALAEWRYGAGRGCSSMMFCTMGTGFGSGLILNDTLYQGATGDAGEIGHVRLTPHGPEGYGKSGSVEGYCGGSGIARLARLRLADFQAPNDTSLRGKGDALSARCVADAAHQGDAFALAIWEEVGTMLGHALAVAVDLLNLERVVIGGIFGRCEALIRPAMERTMRQECLPQSLAACSVHASALGERIGDFAALTVAQVATEHTARAQTA